MESILIIIVIIIVAAYYKLSKEHIIDLGVSKPKYNYQAKQYLMTKSECVFFHILDKVAGDRYYIFPQVHLSAILDGKINGRARNAAFKHINEKSVDYVLCDKQTLSPVYAVELDDYTHNYSNRIERDQEVERIFQSAGIPLVRFSDYKNLNQDEISKRFFEARNSNI